MGQQAVDFITARASFIDDILSSGYKPEGEAIPVYQLVHPEHGEVFIYIDGNHNSKFVIFNKLIQIFR